MAVGAITLSQMLQQPFVTGVFSRYKAAGTAFQSFYRMKASDQATEPLNLNRHLVYDIFDKTRTMAQLRPPGTGPAKVAPKPIGQAQATALRIYESIPFPYEKVYGMRPLGGQYGGPLDTYGRNWTVNQMKYQAARFANALEFMVTRMFRGGFSVSLSGDEWTFGELTAGMFDVAFNIPAGNKTDVGGIIDVLWSNTGAKIINHMFLINKDSELKSGYQVKHCWLNSTTLMYMMANTQLQTIRGTANRVFENFRQFMSSTTEEERQIGYTLEFPAMPQFVFHLYDAVSVVATQTDPATPSTANSSLYIPDGKVIMTPEPEPGGWHGKYDAGEPIRENDHEAATLKTGLSSWSRNCNDPAGEELVTLVNTCPLLYVPNCIYYVTVA